MAALVRFITSTCHAASLSRRSTSHRPHKAAKSIVVLRNTEISKFQLRMRQMREAFASDFVQSECFSPKAAAERYYGFTVTIVTAWGATRAESLPVIFPISLCSHRSRTAALSAFG